jgi:purine nucleoside phosphorylase
VDIYKLRIMCEKWTHNLGVCMRIRAELKTAPEPGMMRMVGFSDDGAIVTEVPVGDVAGIAQHLDLLMLN